MPVDLQVTNHVAYVTLNRPEAMNALDPEAIANLTEIWRRVGTDPEIRVAVLTGAGERSLPRQ